MKQTAKGNGSASFVGLERFVGRIGPKAGTFVLQRTGVFENGQVKEAYVRSRLRKRQLARYSSPVGPPERAT